MDYSWLENDEYENDIREICLSVTRDALLAKTEAQTAAAFQNQLYYYIRKNTGVELNFRPETPIAGGLTHNFGALQSRTSGRGRLDAVVNRLLIEYKKHSKLNTKKEQETAACQVRDYLRTLYQNEGVKYLAILTDGVRISYFAFSGEVIESTSFRALAPKDIDRIIRAILNNNCKRFLPENILRDFSVDAGAQSVSKKLALSLYDKLCSHPTEKTQMLFAEWESLMHLSFDDSGKSNDIARRRSDLSLIFRDTIASPDKEYRALFALQTAYAVIVKLIACKVMGRLEYGADAKIYADLTRVTSSDLQRFLEKLEDGYVYRSNNITNLLEGDFFSWYSSEKQWDAGLWETITEIISCIDGYSSFSFDISYEPVDIFNNLYMSIIPKSVRHSMGEYFTPDWLADYVVTRGISLQPNADWKAMDPCCGSGTFLIALIRHIVGSVRLCDLTEAQKEDLRRSILERVYGIDINPLSVLSARVSYYLALRPFGDVHDIEIPVYLGDSAITPTKETIDSVECFRYSVESTKKSFDVILPARFVRQKDFGLVMASLQAAVNADDSDLLFETLRASLSDEEKNSLALTGLLRMLADDLVDLHRNHWDGIWVRIATNFMLIARLSEFDLLVGNPPWVKWEHLPSKYAEKIKELCNVKHIFSTRGRFGGTQLNICALISNVAAANWLKTNGLLAFLMPDSIMSQNSYEEFRYFYTDYESSKRLYLQCIDKWEKPLKPFTSEGIDVSQDFNTYYYSAKTQDYSRGIDVTTVTRQKNVPDIVLNKIQTFEEAKKFLIFGKKRAAQMSPNTSAFSYLSDEHDFSRIIGPSAYEYRTGVEFTPQELYMLVGKAPAGEDGCYRFENRKFNRSKYIVDDMPAAGWKLPTQYIYPIATGPALKPFHCHLENEYCILPYSREKTDAPVSVQQMLETNRDLYRYLLNHRSLIDSQSEKSKDLHRGTEFYALSKIGPYTFSKYIVAARDNTNFCASVITPSKTAWGEVKQTICVKHTMLIGRDITGREISGHEAYYLCGILNSDIVIQYIHNTFKSNGYSLKKSQIYLPRYDSRNPIHRAIAQLARKASQLSDADAIAKIQTDLSDLYLTICSQKESS